VKKDLIVRRIILFNNKNTEEENKTELVIKEVENKVVEITKFDVTKQQLEELVTESKKIVVTDYRDKTQVALATKSCKELRDIEIDIEKKGKSYRDVFTKVNRGIKGKQDELLGVTNPEIERLKEIKDKAEEVRINDERLAKLPERRERIDSIGSSFETTDALLLALNDSDFESHYNICLHDKLETDKQAAEEKRLADEAKLEAERAKLAEDKRLADEEAARKAQEAQDAVDAEAKRVADEVEAKRVAAQAIIDAENAKIAADRKKLEDEKADIERQKQLRAAEQKAADDAVARAEQKAKERKAEEARLEALKPDKEKLVAYADALVLVKKPEVETGDCNIILETSQELLANLIKHLKQ